MNTSRELFRLARLPLIAACCAASCGSFLLAGPLNPPAGAVASTAKPLAEIEPRTALSAVNTPGDADSVYKITQPGSYYLTGNLIGEANKHGIEIAANDVTVDLMGFELIGTAGGLRSLDGITTTVGSLHNICVRNGSVRDWGDEGVDLGSITSYNAMVIDVRASDNGGGGIVTNLCATVSRCKSYNNSGLGISTSYYSNVSGCTSYSNGLSGVIAGRSSTVTGCASNDNGTHGFALDAGCTITGCTADGNTNDGYNGSAGCTVSSCTAYNNTGNGILLSSGGGTINNCTSRVNFGHGISVTSDCLVLSNACSKNGNGASIAAGIFVSGSNNRVEGNSCVTADYGLQVSGTGNIIVKNTCAANTTFNWAIAANNVCGPVLNRTAPASAAISGDSGVSSLASTDPNANFTH
jgi:parallel beta-helix repeat protein